MYKRQDVSKIRVQVHQTKGKEETLFKIYFAKSPEFAEFENVIKRNIEKKSKWMKNKYSRLYYNYT